MRSQGTPKQHKWVCQMWIWLKKEHAHTHAERKTSKTLKKRDAAYSVQKSKRDFKWNEIIVSCLRFQFQFRFCFAALLFDYLCDYQPGWLTGGDVISIVTVVWVLYWFSISSKRQQLETVGASGRKADDITFRITNDQTKWKTLSISTASTHLLPSVRTTARPPATISI